MKRYYVTKKRINEFIETKLLIYDSLDAFREDLKAVISECDDSMRNQKHFYSKVLKQIS